MMHRTPCRTPLKQVADSLHATSTDYLMAASRGVAWHINGTEEVRWSGQLTYVSRAPNKRSTSVRHLRC